MGKADNMRGISRRQFVAALGAAAALGQGAAAAQDRRTRLIHDPEVTESMWGDAAKRHFRGTVVVGRDLLEV